MHVKQAGDVSFAGTLHSVKCTRNLQVKRVVLALVLLASNVDVPPHKKGGGPWIFDEQLEALSFILRGLVFEVVFDVLFQLL